MPIEGIEWVVVLGVALAMILWTPERIPDIARAIGRFFSELQKARVEADRYVSDFLKPLDEAARMSDWQLIEAARRLDIVTDGLRRDEIVTLINKKLEELTRG